MDWQKKPGWFTVTDRNVSQRYDYWERRDGALVKQWAAPWREGALSWVAYPPGSGEHGYWGYRHRGGVWTPRVWKSAEAAMKALDKVFPIEVVL